MKYAFLSVLFVLAGCAASEPVSVRHDAARNATVYSTQNINLGNIFPTGGLSSGPRVYLTGRASCQGQGCTPQRAQFSFSLSKGAESLQLVGSRSVEFSADQERFSWPQNEMERPSFTHGSIARITLTMDQLQQISNAESVSGEIGGESFSISYDQRAPLRALIAEMTK